MDYISIASELHEDYTSSTYFNAHQLCVEEGVLPQYCDVEIVAVVNFYSDKGLTDCSEIAVAFEGRVTLTDVLEALDGAYEECGRELGVDKSRLRHWFVDRIDDISDYGDDYDGALVVELILGT